MVSGRLEPGEEQLLRGVCSDGRGRSGDAFPQDCPQGAGQGVGTVGLDEREGLAFYAVGADATPFSPTGEGGGGSWEGRHEV